MIVKSKGCYKLERDLTVRGSINVKTLVKGTIINISQVDEYYHKVIGEELGDWVYWNLPVIKVNKTVK